MGELLLSRHRQSGVSGARQLYGCAVASVVALQAQDQTKQGRQLSTLAPLRDLRAPLSATSLLIATDRSIGAIPQFGLGVDAAGIGRADGRAEHVRGDDDQ